MGRFKIYPKDGEEFTLIFLRFELVQDREIFSFSIFNDNDEPTGDAHLSVENIAAIIAENHQQTSRCFQVHLRNREPLAVYADRFEVNDPAVEFFLKTPERDISDALRMSIPEVPKVDGVYVALSEVIAIMPVTN